MSPEKLHASERDAGLSLARRRAVLILAVTLGLSRQAGADQEPNHVPQPAPTNTRALIVSGGVLLGVGLAVFVGGMGMTFGSGPLRGDSIVSWPIMMGIGGGTALVGGIVLGVGVRRPRPSSFRICETDLDSGVNLLRPLPNKERLAAIIRAHVRNMVRVGDVLYAACWNNGMAAVSLSSVQQPQRLLMFAEQDVAKELAIDGNMLLVHLADGRTLAFDITHPERPVPVTNRCARYGGSDWRVCIR